MNKFNKRRKATSIPSFEFPTLYNKFPHNKLLMVLNSWTEFCFDGRENQYITFNSYGSWWVKDVKDNVICLNKQHVKYAVPCFLFDCFFIIGPKIFFQIISNPIECDPVSVFANQFLCFYESKSINEIKKNNLIKARKLTFLGLLMTSSRLHQ